MERYFCAPAGVLLAIAALAASSVTGYVAYDGFARAVDGLPLLGVIGPVLSVALVCVGIGAAAALQAGKRLLALGLAVALVAGALVERNGTKLSFDAQVAEAEQAQHDRNASHTAAVAALAKVRKEIAALTAERDLMTSGRIAEAQTRLAALGLYRGKVDGERGPVTLKAMADRGIWIGARLDLLDSDDRRYSPIVEAGEQVSENAFSAAQAEFYSFGLSILSILLAFAAPVVGGLGQRTKEEKTADELADVLDTLTERLDTRRGHLTLVADALKRSA